MRKFTIVLSAAALLAASGMTTGCSPAKHHVAKPTKKSVEVYHFADGRYGYRGDDGMWWYYAAAMNNSGSSYSNGLTNNPKNITIPESGARSSLSSPYGGLSGSTSSTGGSTVSSPTSAPAAPNTAPISTAAPSAAPAADVPVATSERGGFGSMGQQFQTGTWAKGNPPTEEDLEQAGPPAQLEMDFGPQGQPLTEQEAQTEETEAEAPTAEAESATPSGETAAPSEGTSESSAPSSDSGSSGDSGGGGDGGGGGGSD